MVTKAIKTRRKRIIKSPEEKTILELKDINKTLNKLLEILDNMWNERKPTGG
jgi:hypothetical protein